MRSFIKTLITLFLIAISQGCMEDIESARENVAIRFTLPSESAITDLPTDTRLLLNIQSQQGDPVLEMEEVKFVLSENGFVTEPLDLPFGNYTITDFMLLNQQEEMIFAVPRGQGVLCQTIASPLNYDFQIRAGSRPNISLELLDANKHKPGDFGYASFRKPVTRLGIMVSLEGSPKPTTARAYIINGNDTVSRYSLLARMNHLILPSGITENHKLVVFKPGYASAQFILLELLQSLKNKPLRVVLSEAHAFTMLAYIDLNSSSDFQFDLAGPEGASVTIDWGDGTTETYGLGEELHLVHPYSANGNYPISITGDVDKITYFYSFYGQGMIDSIDFQYVTDLVEIRFGLTRSPRVLDLSHNSKLEFALLAGLSDLETIYLPEEHNIRWFMVDGNGFSTTVVDALIDNVYQNTVNKNIVDGQLSLAANLFEEDETLIGPPSAAAFEKLRVLRDDYGWTLYPDPFD